MREKPIPGTPDLAPDSSGSDNEHQSVEEILIPADTINDSTSDTDNTLNPLHISNISLDVPNSNGENGGVEEDSGGNNNGRSLCGANDIGNDANGGDDDDTFCSEIEAIDAVHNSVVQSDRNENLDDANGGGDETSNIVADNTGIMADDSSQHDVENASSIDTYDGNNNNNQPDTPPSNVELKREAPQVIPIYGIASNNDDILNELEVRRSEELTFEGTTMEVTYMVSKGFGKPLNATLDGLVKLEQPDLFSGWIGYITTVS